MCEKLPPASAAAEVVDDGGTVDSLYAKVDDLAEYEIQCFEMKLKDGEIVSTNLTSIQAMSD